MFINRGGFALVWLARQKKTGQKVAIKQICSKSPTETQLREVAFGQLFFEKDGEIREEIANKYQGIKHS